MKDREACKIYQQTFTPSIAGSEIVQDVQHCFEISSHTMCRLYNTAGISSAAATATATAALPAAVPSRRRLCGAGCVDHEAKKIAYVVIYPSLAEAAADAAHERIFISKGHGV